LTFFHISAPNAGKKICFGDPVIKVAGKHDEGLKDNGRISDVKTEYSEGLMPLDSAFC
jgi:hypothetical protein